MSNLKTSKEWLGQSEYDFETAEDLFKAGRYIYTIFMCHLAVEKCLKAIFTDKAAKVPPKTHDLHYLCELMKLDLPQEVEMLFDILTDLSIPTRYPDQLKSALRQYGKKETKNILDETKKVLKWLKQNSAK